MSCLSYAWPHKDSVYVLDLHILIYMNMTREVASQICFSVNVPRLLFGYVVRRLVTQPSIKNNNFINN